MKTTPTKRQIGIRIPCELDDRLENHVNKIGISKPAFILGLIYKELKNETTDFLKEKDNKTVQTLKN